jgi:hypothetical protein
MRIDPDDDVLDRARVHASTPGMLRVARFVVSLGGTVRAQTAALAACVPEIARGALGETAAMVERGALRNEGKAK